MSDRPFCSAITKKGTQCSKHAVPGGELCGTHMGATKKSKLTKETADEIVRLITTGILVETAITVAGIPNSTFWDWLNAERTAPGDDRPLKDRIDDAREACIGVHLGRIAQASEKDWRASDRLLKLIDPVRFAATTGPKPTAEVPDGGATDQAGL